jgi:phosphatidylglycerophosphate synthase
MESPIPKNASSRWGWANRLSFARLVMAPICAWLLLDGQNGPALVLYGLAIATDLIDGPLARHRGEASAFGALLDHGSDAVFVSLGLAALALRDLVPAPLPILVALAFTQYTLDSKALAGRPLRASALGRYNGIAYFVMLGTPLIRDNLGITWPSDGVVLALGWLLVASTAISMTDRLIVLLRGERNNPTA